MDCMAICEQSFHTEDDHCSFCFNYVCRNCSKECDKCPMCRESVAEMRAVISRGSKENPEEAEKAMMSLKRLNTYRIREKIKEKRRGLVTRNVRAGYYESLAKVGDLEGVKAAVKKKFSPACTLWATALAQHWCQSSGYAKYHMKSNYDIEKVLLCLEHITPEKCPICFTPNPQHEVAAVITTFVRVAWLPLQDVRKMKDVQHLGSCALPLRFALQVGRECKRRKIPMVCANCGRKEGLSDSPPAGFSNYCTGCQGVRYCSRTCQAEHWKIHRPTCRRPRPVVVRDSGLRGMRGKWCKKTQRYAVVVAGKTSMFKPQDLELE